MVAVYKANVNVMLKPGIADVQGQTIQRALPALGYEAVRSVQVGKHFVVEIDAASRADAEQKLDQMCQRLLANPVIESYEVTIE